MHIFICVYAYNNILYAILMYAIQYVSKVRALLKKSLLRDLDHVSLLLAFVLLETSRLRIETNCQYLTIKQ